MENIEGVRNYLKENYNISDDAELIQALSRNETYGNRLYDE